MKAVLIPRRMAKESGDKSPHSKTNGHQERTTWRE
jgi:hypothetical protein